MNKKSLFLPMLLLVAACGSPEGQQTMSKGSAQSGFDEHGASSALAINLAGYEVCAGETDTRTWSKGRELSSFLRSYIRANAPDPRRTISNAEDAAVRFVRGARIDEGLKWTLCSSFEDGISSAPASAFNN